jgi:hypothetical protein
LKNALAFELFASPWLGFNGDRPAPKTSHNVAAPFNGRGFYNTLSVKGDKGALVLSPKASTVQLRNRDERRKGNIRGFVHWTAI